jgi:glycerol-3-phosphate dehydrogenase subunit C
MERCSGHGGAWGVMKENFPVALKVGKPVARNMKKGGVSHVVSECPLAGDHILQGMEKLDGEAEGAGTGLASDRVDGQVLRPCESDSRRKHDR